ncbi:MAG: hypothetical protein BJ554DRAFT_5220, partial [Olpidium bornovanus]
KTKPKNQTSVARVAEINAHTHTHTHRYPSRARPDGDPGAVPKLRSAAGLRAAATAAAFRRPGGGGGCGGGGRCFRATAASATGVKARLKFIPALPQPRDETGRLKRGGADDVYFHDTGNPVTREAFARAAKDSANADPCFRWLYTGGLRFYDMLEKPRNYLAGDCWTPFRLAEEYGLSVSRVEAIIKSKRTEVAMYRNKARGFFPTSRAAPFPGRTMCSRALTA